MSFRSTARPAHRRSRRRRTAVAGAVAVLAASIVTSLAMSGPASGAVPVPEGWIPVFADDFTGEAGTLPSEANWIVDTGHSYPGGAANWGTGEIQEYTRDPANLALDGTGNLLITPLRDQAGAWTSGRIETQRSDFKPPANGVLRIEARLRLPNVSGEAALGYWPAFWTLGAPFRGNFTNWPGVGEFDVMENVNGSSSVFSTLHCGVNPGGPCNETTGISGSQTCADCQTAFHTYRFEWDRSVSPNQLRWYLDGRQFHQVAENQIDAATWAEFTGHNGYFLLLNVAVGGAFPNAGAGRSTPVSATEPGHPMAVDYVAVWSRG